MFGRTNRFGFVRAAVAVALPLGVLGAQPPAGTLEASVAAALEKARPVLVEHLRLQRGGVLALVCLAAAHDGMTTQDRAFSRALERLARTRLIDNYGAALRLMVAAAVPDMPGRERTIPVDTRRLLRNRLRGGFTYPDRDRTWDLSNSQYAALGLRAAAALGQPIEPKVWGDLLRVVLDAQAEDGGFGYTKFARRKTPYSSMTVAGIGILEICKQLHARNDPRVDPAIERAWKWMAAHAFDIGDDTTTSCFYFHYGLERAAILSAVTEVGGRDWYRAGADMFVRTQRRTGAWSSVMELRPGALGGEGSPIDTAFAVLFLRRKFKRSLAPVGPVTPGGRSEILRLDASADVAAVQRAASAEVLRGRIAVPDLLRALRSDLVVRRRAAVLAWPEITGRPIDIDPTVDPEKNSAALKAAERWWLTDGRARAGKAPR